MGKITELIDASRKKASIKEEFNIFKDNSNPKISPEAKAIADINGPHQVAVQKFINYYKLDGKKLLQAIKDKKISGGKEITLAILGDGGDVTKSMNKIRDVLKQY